MASIPDSDRVKVFQQKLSELERIVDIRQDFIDSQTNVYATGKIVVEKTKDLLHHDVNILESKSVEDLERLAEISMKLQRQSSGLSAFHQNVENAMYASGHKLDEIIDSKVDFLMATETGNIGGLNVLDLVARLAKIAKKVDATNALKMSELLASKLSGLADAPEPLDSESTANKVCVNEFVSEEIATLKAENACLAGKITNLKAEKDRLLGNLSDTNEILSQVRVLTLPSQSSLYHLDTSPTREATPSSIGVASVDRNHAQVVEDPGTEESIGFGLFD